MMASSSNLGISVAVIVSRFSVPSSWKTSLFIAINFEEFGDSKRFSSSSGALLA